MRGGEFPEPNRCGEISPPASLSSRRLEPSRSTTMRFGISGCFLPADMDEMTPEICRRVRALGFTGIFTRFARNDPHTTTVAQARRLRRLLSDEGVRLFQATGYWQNLV